MRLLGRIRAALIAALIVLTVALIAAVSLGIVFRPLPPIGYPATDGQPLVRQYGTGQATGTMTITARGVGIGIRCDGTGLIAVGISGIGEVQTRCRPADASDGGFVIADLPNGPRTWHVRTADQNRWALVLTQPVSDGGTTLEP